MMVTSLHQQVEQVRFKVVSEVSLQFTDYLSQLIQAEDRFLFILELKGEAPHIDPAHKHINAFFASWGNLNFDRILLYF
jgi:hypothetical protein